MQYWRDHAACKGAPLDIFFTDEGEKHNKSKIEAALSYCNVCPVREECLDYAIDNGIRVGMYGGMSQRQRKITKRVRKLEAA